MGNKIYVGIDLGTTNTLVSYVKKMNNGNEKNMLLKFDGQNVLPSVMYMDTDDNNNIYIGKDAYAYGCIDPLNMVRSAKTHMGTDKKYTFKSKNGKKIVYTPTDVSAEILKVTKERITKKLKLEDDDEICAVITTPAAFSFNQNEETIKAAKKAGLTVLGTRPEPVAAAIACVNDIGESTIFVVDIGGGTYDTAIISIDDNLTPRMISAEGDRNLGGDDFDNAVFEYIKGMVETDFGIDLSSEDASGLDYYNYYKLISTLRDRAKEAKESLTQDEDYLIVCENLYTIDGYNNNQPVSFSKKIKRDDFNRICSGIYKKIEDRLDESIKIFEEKGNSIKDITHLVLVGGSCYIPAVIELIEKKIGIRSVMGADKTTAVAQGAAEIANNWVAIGDNIGGVLAQSMGIEITGDVFDKIIEKGSIYPCGMAKKYTTTRDNQEYIDISIYAAAPDKEAVKDINEHEYYGYMRLDNIEKAKAGVPDIEVTFKFDNSQQLIVTAKDLGTGSEKTVEIKKESHKKARANSHPVSIDLLIDVSGSMRGVPLRDAKDACTKMIDEIIDLDINEIGITTFGDHSKNICNITNDKKTLENSIDKIESWGMTNMDDGVHTSTEKLRMAKNTDKIIFLMTDGAPDTGDKSELLAKEIRQKYDIKVAVIFIGKKESRGFGIAKNISVANTINTNENPLFYTSNDMSQLGEIFKRVYADITVAK